MTDERIHSKLKLMYPVVFVVLFFIQDAHTRYILNSASNSSFIVLSAHGLIGSLLGSILLVKRGRAHSKAVQASLSYPRVFVLALLHVIGIAVSGVSALTPLAYLEVKQVTAPVLFLLFEAIHDRATKTSSTTYRWGTYTAMILTGLGGFVSFGILGLDSLDFYLGLSAAGVLVSKILVVNKLLSKQTNIISCSFDLALSICPAVSVLSTLGAIVSGEQGSISSIVTDLWMASHLVLNSGLWLALLVFSFASNHFVGPYSMVLLFQVIQSLFGMAYGNGVVSPIIGGLLVIAGYLSYLGEAALQEKTKEKDSMV